MSGSTDRLWVVTTQFNPAGYKSLNQNYLRFSQHLALSGVNLLCAELSYPGQWPTLYGPEIRHFRARSIMWHKERLLNLIIKQLPDSCDMVAWIDADILFTNPNWAQQTVDALQQHPAVQLWERCIMLDAEGNFYNDAYGFAFSYTSGYLDGIRDRYSYHNGNLKHPGYAWAARRDVIERWGGLYDYHILGGGDFQMALSMIGSADSDWYGRFGEKFQRHMLRWSNLCYSVTGGNIGFIPGCILHLWHGHSEDRRYVERSRCLVEHDYDPEVDIASDDNGMWYWSSNKPLLHERVANYFNTRSEDRNFPVHPTRYEDKYPLVLLPDGDNDRLKSTLQGIARLNRTDFCVHVACHDWKQANRIRPVLRDYPWPFQHKMVAQYHYPGRRVPKRFQIVHKLGQSSNAKRCIFADCNTAITPDMFHRLVRPGAVILDNSGHLLAADRALIMDRDVRGGAGGEERLIGVARRRGIPILTVS